MKKIISLLLVLLMLPIAVSAQTTSEEGVSVPTTERSEGVSLPVEDSPDLYEEEFEEIAQEDIYEDIEDVPLKGEAGITPDSALYVLENFIETITVGNNPETALEYKEEKVLEAKEMIEAGDEEAAEKALERVDKYNDILQKEVTPELDVRVRESSKATKELLGSYELEGEEWDDVNKIIDENLKDEDKIALAAKISRKIRDLCETLSDLDPLEYSRVCKTDDDAPRWKRDLDRKLTQEQEEEAKEFFGIMSECFQNPSECRCDDISVKPFAEQCSIIAPLAASCEAGDDEACEKMEDVGDPIDLLPDYLQDVMEDVEDRYGESKHGLHIPMECVAEGALTKDACMRVMFKLHAPAECLEALERGEIDPQNEREAREACEEIMWDLDAPQECKDAGLKDHRECDRLMFRLDAPQECIDAGLTGSGRDDWKKCDLIRFKLDAPQECLDAGITGERRDDWKKCELIKFKLDAPQECLDAGLTGSGRDDWRKCDAIKFKLDAHPDCLAAGLTGEGRDDWRKCNVITFKADAHPACLEAGLTGSGGNDWRKCQVIQFKAEAPEECLEAGLDGSRRDDWDKCHEISDGRKKGDDQGARREDCDSDDLHICEDGYCECISKEDYDERHGYGDDDDDNGIDCAVIYCPPGSECIDGIGCKTNDDDKEESECKDGCSDECPGADRTDCVDDGMRCECYYETTDSDEEGVSDNPGGEDITGGGGYDGSDDNSDDSGSDDSSSDDSGDNTEAGITSH